MRKPITLAHPTYKSAVKMLGNALRRQHSFPLMRISCSAWIEVSLVDRTTNWVQNDFMRYDPHQLPQLLASLYRVLEQLESVFPGLLFAPDGLMADSLGKALVSYHYGISLHPASDNGHDGTVGGRNIQIRVTQLDTIAINSEPEHLIAIRLLKDGSFEELYNGPGANVWRLVSEKRRPKNGQYAVRVSQLRNLMKSAKFASEQQVARTVRDKPSKPWMS